MSRLSTNFTPSEQSTQLLDGIKKSMGMVPNIFKIMSQSPNVLEGYLSFSASLGKGSLSAQDREQIALAVAGYDKCEYCASAHTLLAQKTGVSAAETQKNLKGSSETPKTASLITFCLAVVKTKGFVSDTDLTAVRNAGFTDPQIVEIVANIATNIFTNYFNHVAGTENDFPKVSLD